MRRLLFLLSGLLLCNVAVTAETLLTQSVSDRIDALLSEEDYATLASFTQEQLTITPQQPRLQHWQAISQYRLGDTKGAMELLTASLEEAPNEFDNHYALGVLAVRRAGEVGITHIRKYLLLAESHFQRCIELDAGSALARFYLIRIYQNAPELMDDDKELLPRLQNQLEPLDATLYQVSKVYDYIEAKQLDSAQQLLDPLLSQRTTSRTPPYLSLLAYTQAELALEQEAPERLLESAQWFMNHNNHWSDMLDVDGYIFIGQAHALNGDKQAAKVAYQQAKAIAQHKRSIRYIERLERKLLPPKPKK